MDYEKEYKEAFERAKNLHKDAIDMGENIRAKQCEIIFPKLAESEDERTRKEIITFIKSRLAGFPRCDNYVAWLEKQGEKEFTFKSIPRLLEMIEPTDRAKSYCKKLIDSLVKEGYTTDAKIVGECLKQMNGEDVPMAVMDE